MAMLIATFLRLGRLTNPVVRIAIGQHFLSSCKPEPG
jgi:hypothetical protein